MRSFVIGVPLLLCVGCGIFVNNDKEGSESKIDTRLLGVWETDCFKGQDAVYAKEVYKFDALGGFEKRTILHRDAACQDETLQQNVSGSYELQGQDDSQPKATRINYQVKKVLMRAHSDEEARRLNETKTCGKGDWRAEEDVEADKMTCAGESYHQGQALYDIYELDGDALYVGKPLMFFGRDDPDARPFKVNTEKPFFKK